jgi:hypothetical protein
MLLIRRVLVVERVLGVIGRLQRAVHAYDCGIIHLVAPTEADYRDVMIHGPAGLVTIAKPEERPRYIKQDRKVLFPNGAYAICFAAERPERLRGPQCEAAWCYEIAAWRCVDHTWDMMSFGLRLGTHPQVFISTTPKPIPLLKRLIKDPTCALTKGPPTTIGRTSPSRSSRRRLRPLARARPAGRRAAVCSRQYHSPAPTRAAAATRARAETARIVPHLRHRGAVRSGRVAVLSLSLLSSQRLTGAFHF